MCLILIVQNDTDIQWICCKHMLKHRGNKMAKIVMMLLFYLSCECGFAVIVEHDGKK